MTQNNRATILSDLATLPGEDRRQRLYDALAAYDEALRFRRPDTAPLAYAMTQGNMAILHLNLTELDGEDQQTRQRQSVSCAAAAWHLYVQIGHNNAEWAERLLSYQRERFGAEVFDALRQELGLGDPPP